ncbi:hypothetical protein Asfd1_47 [Aeromonas phage Asfd_1]|nr:hypothetical protein Asfd1_47 [Aeromonas phage Asfd_1]
MKNAQTKNNLTAQRLITAGATRVGSFQHIVKWPDAEFAYAKGVTKHDLAKSGFYVIAKDGIAVARTFVGDQETAKGFMDTVNRVKQCIYKYTRGVHETIYRSVAFEHKDHVVYYIPLANISRLLHVQQLELFGENMVKAQSLTVCSRQLFKAYNFEYQKR